MHVGHTELDLTCKKEKLALVFFLGYEHFPQVKWHIFMVSDFRNHFNVVRTICKKSLRLQSFQKDNACCVCDCSLLSSSCVVKLMVKISHIIRKYINYKDEIANAQFLPGAPIPFWPLLCSLSEYKLSTHFYIHFCSGDHN